jgi:hypothetical protein
VYASLVYSNINDKGDNANSMIKFLKKKEEKRKTEQQSKWEEGKKNMIETSQNSTLTDYTK